MSNCLVLTNSQVPPDPEDAEDTELEPEEVTVDAGGGKER